MPRQNWISFLTDYGLDDVYVGVCHGVIARSAPHARVIDVCHTVPSGSIAAGARLLAKAAPYLPAGIVLAVVDPGVGTSRRPIGVLAGDSILVGPDNGLLLPAAEALGGVRAAFELTGHTPASMTFHGRDLFAPVAAQLALGLEPKLLGPQLDHESLVMLPAPKVKVTAEAITGEVALVDSFGNLQTTVVGDASAMPVGARVMLFFGGRRRIATVGRTFADVARGKLMLYVDSAGYLAVAVNGGNAAQKVGVGPGTEITIRR
ncbi:MAG TPA: SAM-dependent chlorinase/fluorinase [Pseudonocardiaceae bacterium]